MILRLQRVLLGVLLGALGSCNGEEPSGTARTAAGGTGNSAGSGAARGGAGGASAGTGGVPSGGYCAVWESRLRECGLIDSGRYEGCLEYSDQAEVCEIGCIGAATCAAVGDQLCGTGDEIFDCQGACIGETPLVCNDGSRFSYDYRCDGFDDCLEGEDETGCTITNGVKCRNADERIPESALCDGKPDCSDASDEPAGCAAVFTCSDGTELPAVYACDGIVDCPDGGDEPSDCAKAACG